MLVTPPFPTITCGTGAAERKLQVTGAGVIGKTTKPECNHFSTVLTVIFKRNGAGTAQEHIYYTGKNFGLEEVHTYRYDVTAVPEKGMVGTFSKALKLVCT